MFGRKVQVNILEDRIGSLIRLIYDIGSEVNELISRVTQNKNILVQLEMYVYLQNLLDLIMVTNNVDGKYRKAVFDAIYNVIPLSKKWSDLKIDQKTMNSFIDNRIENYSKIINKAKRIDEKYFESIIEYQVQLIANIAKNNELSFYNPLPQNPSEYSPMHLDLILLHGIKSALIDYYTDSIIRFSKLMSMNLVNEYFCNPDYKAKSIE
jgi:hypothetical protein